MDFDDRASWMFLGCLIGFALGYIVRALREIKSEVSVIKEEVEEIKEEVDEIDEVVKAKRDLRRSDDGFMHVRILRDVAVLIVVVLTAFAAFASQRASDSVKETQEQQTKFISCSNKYLAETIKALNERTRYAQETADTNVELQRAQKDFFSLILRKPPESEAVRSDAARAYLNALRDFLAVSRITAIEVEKNPYPTSYDLESCLKRR